MELSACNSNRERITTLFRIAKVLTAEAVGALFMVPYGTQLCPRSFIICRLLAQEDDKQAICSARSKYFDAQDTVLCSCTDHCLTRAPFWKALSSAYVLQGM
jgi:hypothetical protein